MRTLWIPALLLASSAGCSGMSNTGKGVLTGGTLGGLMGAGIGSVAGNAGAGAAIGAGLGGLMGGAVGSDIDRQDKEIKRAAAAQALRQMSMQDVIFMAHNHTSDDLIINQIESSGSTFNLRPEDVVHLRGQGVSERVIGYMQARRGPVAVAPALRPVRHVERVYVVEEPPPVSVGFGIYSGPRHRHRCW